MGFGFAYRSAALVAIGQHLTGKHPVEVWFAISDEDGVVTAADGGPVEWVVDLLPGECLSGEGAEEFAKAVERIDGCQPAPGVAVTGQAPTSVRVGRLS